jgi:hypothetical protein
MTVRRSRPAKALLPALIAAGTVSPASAHVSPQDAAATHAYVEAGYTYAQAVVANLPVSRAAFEGLTNKIVGECPGVLAGAPSALGFTESNSSTARRSAELRREEGQAGLLQAELDSALGLAFAQPNHQAAQTYAASVMPLQWSDATLTGLVRQHVAELQERLGLTAPDVCADMRAWVASGYRTLSIASKEFRDREEQRTALRTATRRTSPPLLLKRLARYENAGDKSLIRKAERLSGKELSLLKPLVSAEERLQHALGATPPARLESALEPAKGGVTIGRGRTAAGESYVAKLRRNSPHSRAAQESGCRLSLSIRNGGGSGSSSNRFTTCMSRSGRPAEPSVNCGSARLTVTLDTLPAARSVRLRLSNGREITSRVLFASPRFGGPAGFYYQVVRGPSPIPVALAELDAHGRTLRVVALPHIVECTQHPLKYFPGGIRTLVNERVPSGPAFTIVGERYRFLGHVYFELKLHLEEFGESELGGFSRSIGGAIILTPRPRALDWQIETGCKPHPYAILYSLLKSPQDTVLARTAGVLTAWRSVSIPASMHAGGVLVYTVLPAPPEELLIRAPDGKTIHSEKLAPLATEAAETCEGEAEG